MRKIIECFATFAWTFSWHFLVHLGSSLFHFLRNLSDVDDFVRFMVLCKLSRPGQSTMVWSRTDLRATTALARCLVATPVVEFTRTNLHGPCRRSFPLWPALSVGPQQCFAEISA